MKYRIRRSVLPCLLSLLLLLLLATACSDSSESGGNAMGALELRIRVQSEGESIVYNEVRYENTAGNLYSVTEFNFLMTQLTLSGSGGTVVLSEALGGQSPDPTVTYTFDDVPVGDFDSLRFQWGAAGGQNEDGALPQGIIDPWPSMLGGGYHAMQLEGNWDDGSPEGKAYVMHAGHLRRCSDPSVMNYEDCAEADRINQTGMAGVSLSGFSASVAPNETTTLELIIDVNGWMADPLYDLSEPWADQSICPLAPTVCTLGFPTMSGPQPQQMMQENAGNVFSVGSVSQN